MSFVDLGWKWQYCNYGMRLFVTFANIESVTTREIVRVSLWTF